MSEIAPPIHGPEDDVLSELPVDNRVIHLEPKKPANQPDRLDTAQGLALMKAFHTITDPDMRFHAVQYVEDLARRSRAAR